MNGGRHVSVIGLGYVGLPLAVAFGNHGGVTGFDLDAERIRQLREGIDRNGEVDARDLAASRIRFTNDPADLKQCDFHIVAAPTPLGKDNKPDLKPLYRASEIAGSALKPGDIVVFESTVYPGVSEEECVPILQDSSRLKCGVDFQVGYSPERINPGDTGHSLSRITKVVSAQNDSTLRLIVNVYRTVVEAGIYEAPCIKVAEAAKILENTQRDLNIALMNELAMICERLNIDTLDVIHTAATKWNFMPFVPGLVGGHCIGVDSYYLTYKAEELGHNPQVILAGRSINDGMGDYVVRRVVAALRREGLAPEQSLVSVLGFTFKENVSDVRNSGVMSVVEGLRRGGAEVQVHDPRADRRQCRNIYGVELVDHERLERGDAAVVAVAHEEYRKGGWPMVMRCLRNGRGIVVDVKGILDRDAAPSAVRLYRI